MSTLPIMKPYINGQYIDSKSEKFNTIYDPSTGKAIAQVPCCTKEEVEAEKTEEKPKKKTTRKKKTEEVKEEKVEE